MGWGRFLGKGEPLRSVGKVGYALRLGRSTLWHVPCGTSISASAAPVVFAHQKGPMAAIVRTIGRARAETEIGMLNLAYNMRRFMWLERKGAPACLRAKPGKTTSYNQYTTEIEANLERSAPRPRRSGQIQAKAKAKAKVFGGVQLVCASAKILWNASISKSFIIATIRPWCVLKCIRR